MTPSVDLLQGVMVGIAAAAVYQAVIAIQMFEKDGHWPWRNPNKPLLNGRNFIGVSIIRMIIAGCLIWLFIITKQISGLLAAAALGAIADEVVLRVVDISRKAYKDEQAV